MYRENIHYHTCRDTYTEQPICIYCIRKENIVDLRGIGPNSHSPCERIIGDLDELGWMLVRGVRIDELTFKEIKGMTSMGRTAWGGT